MFVVSFRFFIKDGGSRTNSP
uniref:Uncharacterized protein n=1 Tax=Plectus sambesii TaxID=2011161 RepID=A0A914VG13_9BILA